MFTADGWREGCERCIEMLEFGGLGHTMVIHSSDRDIIMKFALEKPACRILVNTQAALGAVGYTNELLPSMTLGPGTFGKSIISENVSAKHLINIKRLAFETRPINKESETGVRTQDSGPRIRTQHATRGTRKQKARQQHEVGWKRSRRRIRLKAGNQPVHFKPHGEEQMQKEVNKEAKYGTGMTIDDVERVMKEFQK